MDNNIITAIVNLVNHTILTLGKEMKQNNRANAMGTALEDYIKNLFSSSFNLKGQEQIEKWEKVFSYLGNNTNPPDMMLRGGDAIEVKKIKKKTQRLL